MSLTPPSTIKFCYSGNKGREVLTTVLANRALKRGDISPSSKAVMTQQVEARKKGQKKIIKAQLLTRSPEAMLEVRDTQPKTPFRKRLQTIAKGLKYPILNPKEFVASIAKKSSTKSASVWPSFSAAHLSEASLARFNEAGQLVSQAAIALNQGKHFHHALGMLDQANWKIFSILPPEEKQLLQASGLMYEQQGELTLNPDRTDAFINTLKSAVDKRASTKPLNPVEKALFHWYSSMEGRVNLAHGAKTDLTAISKTQTRRFQNKMMGAYPVRKPNNTPYQVKGIAASNIGPISQKSHSTEAIKPLISSQTTPEERAQLRRNNITVRPLTEQEKGKYEGGIKDGAFAARDFEAGEFISDYGAVAVPKQDRTKISNDEYLRGAGDHFVADGDTPLSRANTKVEYATNAQGQVTAIRESRNPKDFNAELVGHPARLEDGKAYILGAGYTTRAVKKGEEFRLPYGYTPEQIQRKMN
jgi:hypothetical protein